MVIHEYFILFQLVASGVAAYRVELYSSLFVGGTNLPTGICNFTENNNEYRGDRICNNAIGAAVSTVIVAVVLMIIDLLIPCIETAVRIPPLFFILSSLSYSLINHSIHIATYILQLLNMYTTHSCTLTWTCIQTKYFFKKHYCRVHNFQGTKLSWLGHHVSIDGKTFAFVSKQCT